MNPSTIVGSLCALALSHATVSACSLALYGRDRAGAELAGGRRDRTLLTFAAVNLGVVALDGALAASSALAPEDAAGALLVVLRVAQASRVIAAAVLVHFALQYARLRPPSSALGAVYAAAAVLVAAHGVGAIGAATGVHQHRAVVAGVSVPFVHATPSLLGAIGAVFAIVAATSALAILARSSARGWHEAAGGAGIAILLATLVHDAIREVGLSHGLPLAPLGYFAFVNGAAMTMLARFSMGRGELERRASELDELTRDLERAYIELRAAQDELVKKEQLAAVGELSAVVAHEVRNPLAIMANAVATLRRDGVGDDDRATLLRILDEESTRLNRLVGDLLRYARPIALERQLVGLRELVERGLALTEGKIGIDVELVEPSPTAKVWADPNLLRQVIDNLIDNALQAMSTGGVLTVTLADAEHAGARGVEIQIQDTGDGMDTGVRSRALDPFFTTRPSGTGLGLAIVARIVDAHGGRIRIKSAAGAGTVMHVFLPCSAPDAPPSRFLARESRSDSGRRSADEVLPEQLAKSLRREG